MFKFNSYIKIHNPFQNFLAMAEASTTTPERTLRPRKVKNTTENTDSTTQYKMTDKVESPSTRERKTREAWIMAEETAEAETENQNQSTLAIHTSLDLGVDYIEGNTTLEVMITSGDTTAEEVEQWEEEAWKEDAGLDQDQRQKSPEHVGSSTPKYSAKTEGEYTEDMENMLETKEELLEADTWRLKKTKHQP